MIDNQSYPPVIRTLRRLRMAFWRRRVVHWLIRALWLALLVPTVVMGGYLWQGWHVPWDTWISLMLLVGSFSLLWSLRPINLKRMARRLDNLLGMRAQLITAYEVSQASQGRATPIDNPVVDKLVQDSVNFTVNLRRQVSVFGRGFWLEMNALIAVAAILGAMLLFDVLRPNIPNAPELDFPIAGQEPQADQVIPPDPRLQPQPQQLQQLSDSQLRDILQILADALRDQAVTHPVAEAIDRDDLGGAAEELRRVADRLEDLSGEAHRELGDSLQEAADKIGADAPNITEPLQRGKQALDINNLPGASRALDDLAEVLENLDQPMPESKQAESNNNPSEPKQEQTEQTPEQNDGAGDGAGEGGSANQPPQEEEERLPVDGQPLELKSDQETEASVLQSAEPDAQAGEKRTEDAPFTRQPLNASGDDLGPDPLTYPWEKRDIIRQYFTP